MDPRLTTYVVKAASAVLIVAGLVVVLVGYLGVRDEPNVELQIPYLASGGIGGLALVGLGVAGCLWAGIREQTQRFAEVVDALEEWKDTALAEFRQFLETAEVQVDVVPPVYPVPQRRRPPVKT